MTDKEKILQYLEYKGINLNKFSISTGLSPRFFSSGKSLSVENLRIIANVYSDLSIEWVVLDKGKMLKNVAPEIEVLHEPKVKYQSTNEIVLELVKQNGDLREEIGRLKNDVKILCKNS